MCADTEGAQNPVRLHPGVSLAAPSPCALRVLWAGRARVSRAVKRGSVYWAGPGGILW